jgi:hypothetical protein
MCCKPGVRGAPSQWNFRVYCKQKGDVGHRTDAEKRDLVRMLADRAPQKINSRVLREVFVVRPTTQHGSLGHMRLKLWGEQWFLNAWVDRYRLPGCVAQRAHQLSTFVRFTAHRRHAHQTAARLCKQIGKTNRIINVRPNICQYLYPG